MLPDHSGITDGQTIEKVHENNNDEENESNQEQIAAREQTIVHDLI